jgi:hypothetical protein
VTKLPKNIRVIAYSDPNIIRPPGQEQLQRKFKPYAVELGLLVYSWNRLQDKLLSLFWAVLGTPSASVPQAIWHAILSDRAQRQMLLAASRVAPLRNERARADIKWIIDHVERFEDKRNDAIHSPLTFMTDHTGTALASAWISGNPRAKKLRDKNLLNEFRWYSETAAVLGSFAQRIYFRLKIETLDEEPWPERPQLPQLRQSAARKAKPRQKKAKSHRRPPPPSRA